MATAAAEDTDVSAKHVMEKAEHAIEKVEHKLEDESADSTDNTSKVASDAKAGDKSMDKSADKTDESSAGLAKIKPQYIDTNHKRLFITEYLPEAFAAELRGTDSREDDGDEAGPPQKKVKLKGRNKKRPIEKKQDAANKICPHLVNERECPFGPERCKFGHDLEEFMKNKPPGVGEHCYMYETFGKCPHGVACLWSAQHLTADRKNIVNEAVYKEGRCDVKNALPKDLQTKLWKKRYDFSRANNVWKAVKGEESTNQKKHSDVSKNGSEAANNGGSNLSGSQGEKPTDLSTKVDGAGVDNASPRGDVTPAPKEPMAAHQTRDDVTPAPKEPMAAHQTRDDVTPAPTEPMDVEGGEIRLRDVEKPKIDFRDKLYLAPLTTVGNLPFRRVCKQFGADVTCGEMSMATNLLQGQASEWALLKRHASEDLFGVQLCGSFPDTMTRCAQLITEQTEVDFIDINCGCPIDLMYKRGEGSALMGRAARLEQVVHSMNRVMDKPLTVKIRTGIHGDKSVAHTLVPRLRDAGVTMVTVHGRSREQRYTRMADWDYINRCALLGAPMPVFGNGDILSYEDYRLHREQTKVSGAMIARGALIKPWLFREIKEERHWDISSRERLDVLRDFVHFGMEQWGSDLQGVANTRRFLLEWLSFLHRYIPVGILERVPQRINEKPPYYFGRDDLETLMASPNCGDWVKISEMLLGPVPTGFTFLPKHRANAYT